MPSPSPRLKGKNKRGIKSIKLVIKNVITDTAEIHRITRDYYKQLYANEMDDLDEMEKILERYNLLRLNQEHRENINKSQIIKLKL